VTINCLVEILRPEMRKTWDAESAELKRVLDPVGARIGPQPQFENANAWVPWSGDCGGSDTTLICVIPTSCLHAGSPSDPPENPRI